MTADQIRTVIPVIVQVASGLPALTTDWVTCPYLRFTGGSEGAGQVLGDATLVQEYGEILPVGARTLTSIGVTPDIARLNIDDDLLGKTVRLLLKDGTGPDFIGDLRHTAFWWGRITREDRNPDGAIGAKVAGGQVSWLAIGIASALDNLYLREGWVKNVAGTGIVDPGYLPPFNALAGGDRSSSTFSVGVETCYVHDLTGITSGNLWSARQILDLILAGGARPRLNPDLAVSGWRWVISDPLGCLDYEPETIDLGSMTVLNALNVLVNPRRGLTWKLSVSNDTATITIHSGSSEPITVGTFTLPASDTTASLDAVDNPWLEGLSIARDDSMVFDAIEVRGAHPWVGITGEYDGTPIASLQKGFDSGAEGLWTADDRESLTDDVYRRFEVTPAWNGEQHDGTAGLRNAMAIASSGSDYGVGGYTGERSHETSASYLAPAFMISAERMLPASVGFSSLRLGARQPPVVVFFDGVDYYEDVSQAFQVEVEGPPLAVRLDDGQRGNDIFARLDVTGAQLLVTIGVREIQPLRVSWQRDPGEWPGGIPRVKLIELPTAEQWIILAGTVTGADPEDGTLLTQATDLVIRDDLPQLRSVLALARARYSVPAYTASWTNRGILDIAATFAPGVLLTSVVQADVATGIYSVITRRSWRSVVRDDVEMFDTIYDTDRVTPDLEAVL